MLKIKSLAALSFIAALLFSGAVYGNVCGAQYDQLSKDYTAKYNAHQKRFKHFSRLRKQGRDHFVRVELPAIAALGATYQKKREAERKLSAAAQAMHEAGEKSAAANKKSEAAHRAFQAANNRFYPVYKKCVVDDKARQWGDRSSSSGSGAATKASASGGSQ